MPYLFVFLALYTLIYLCLHSDILFNCLSLLIYNLNVYLFIVVL